MGYDEFISSPSGGCFWCLQWQDYFPSSQLQVLPAEVDVDLQMMWPETGATAISVRIFKNSTFQGKMFVKRM